MPTKAETYIDRAEDLLLTGGLHWHPFFDSAYAGGGFTLGAGYRRFVSSYNTVDLRGSITFSGYKRIEAEFLAPRLFDRRGVLSVIGGWREATQVGFYGIGTGSRPKDDRANYSFTQPYVSRHGSRSGRRGSGSFSAAGSSTRSGIRTRATARTRRSRRSTRPRRCPAWARAPRTCTRRARPPSTGARAAGYARRGGFYGDHRPRLRRSRQPTSASARSTTRRSSTFPCCATPGCCRCAARVETTYISDDGAGSVLHAAGARRRFVAARLRELALPRPQQPAAAGRMARAGQPVPRHGAVLRRRQGDGRGPKDLSWTASRSDYGLGFRFHGPAATPLRIELAKSNEGLALVFSSKAAF